VLLCFVVWLLSFVGLCVFPVFSVSGFSWMGGWEDGRMRETVPSGSERRCRAAKSKKNGSFRFFSIFFFFFLFCSFVCLFFVVVSDAVSLFLQNVFIIIIPVFMSTKTSNNNNKVSVAKKREFYDPFDFFFGLPMHAMDLSKVRDLDVSSSSSSSLLPRMNVVETETQLEVEVELCGVPKENISIDVSDDDVLTISGKVESKHSSDNNGKEENGKKYHCVERRYGAFSRSIQLPKGTDTAQIKGKIVAIDLCFFDLFFDAFAASSKDGVLTITVAKTEPKTKSTKIAIE
jgi:HSP20 family molecular chaperone IbpA